MCDWWGRGGLLHLREGWLRISRPRQSVDNWYTSNISKWDTWLLNPLDKKVLKILGAFRGNFKDSKQIKGFGLADTFQKE